MKNKIYEIINILAIRDVISEEDKWFLDIFGAGLKEINKDQQARILEYRAALLAGMNKARELLKDWDITLWTDMGICSSNSDIQGFLSG